MQRNDPEKPGKSRYILTELEDQDFDVEEDPYDYKPVRPGMRWRTEWPQNGKIRKRR